MVKHTQVIRRQQPSNCLSMFDHFVGLAFKGLRNNSMEKPVNLRKIRLPKDNLIVPDSLTKILYIIFVIY